MSCASTTPSPPATPADRAERVRALRRRVMRATCSALVLPGAGHWLVGQRLVGAAILGISIAVVIAAVWHLVAGLTLFESPLGSFLFGALLRGGLAVYGFAAADAYLASLEPEDRAGILRRRAFVLNLLVPGSGYLLIRAWLRAVTGLLVLAMIVYFSAVHYHRYADLMLVGAQLVMAIAVYQHLRITEAEAADPARLPRLPLDPVAPAQISALCAATLGLLASAYVVHLRMPDYAFSRVDEDAIEIRPSPAGVEIRVPPLGMSMTAQGDGWIVNKPGSGLLLSAQHENNVTLRVGTELILPFVRDDRYVEHLRRRMVAAGYTHHRTRPLSLNGTAAHQLWFSRSLGEDQHVDQWTIAVCRGHFAFLLLIECNRLRCQETLPVLERTRDSFTLHRPERGAGTGQRRGSRGG